MTLRIFSIQHDRQGLSEVERISARLDGVAEHYPEVKGIMFWEWVWALSSDDYTGQRAFMNHSAVLSRDDPAWERAGRDSEPNP